MRGHTLITCLLKHVYINAVQENKQSKDIKIWDIYILPVLPLSIIQNIHARTQSTCKATIQMHMHYKLTKMNALST